MSKLEDELDAAFGQSSAPADAAVNAMVDAAQRLLLEKERLKQFDAEAKRQKELVESLQGDLITLLDSQKLQSVATQPILVWVALPGGCLLEGKRYESGQRIPAAVAKRVGEVELLRHAAKVDLPGYTVARSTKKFWKGPPQSDAKRYAALLTWLARIRLGNLVKRTVNANSLSGAMRERAEAGLPVRDDLIELYEQKDLSITKR